MMLNPDPQSRHDERGDLVTMDDARPSEARSLVARGQDARLDGSGCCHRCRRCDDYAAAHGQPTTDAPAPSGGAPGAGFHRDGPLTTHSPAITVYGEIVAGRVVDLRALVGGEITAVHPDLEAGRRIDEGAALVEIDRFAYEGAVIEAQANLAEARAGTAESEARSALERDQLDRAIEQVDLAERDLERARQLAERGSLTERDLETRQLTLSQRQQAVDQRQANLRIEEARLDQQRAAIAGWNGAWSRPGAIWSGPPSLPRSPASSAPKASRSAGWCRSMMSSPPSTMTARSMCVYPVGQPVRTPRRRGRASDRATNRRHLVDRRTGCRISGTIDSLDADITAASGGVALFGRLDRETTANLRPGAFVSVSLADQAFDNTVRIPETALYNTDHVFIVVEDRLQRRPWNWLLGTVPTRWSARSAMQA
jgi:multidrug efflux system membrane fusion protein